jgi:PAS domain-containing protein
MTMKKKLAQTVLTSQGGLEQKLLNMSDTSETELYKTLANNLQVGVYITVNKRFQFVNLHIQEYTGYAEAELLEMDPPAWSILTTGQRPSGKPSTCSRAAASPPSIPAHNKRGRG